MNSLHSNNSRRDSDQWYEKMKSEKGVVRQCVSSWESGNPRAKRPGDSLPE